MRKQAHGVNGIPIEFREDSAPEFPVLPDEFNRFPKQLRKEEKRSRRIMRMMLFAAAGLFTLGIFVPVSKENLPIEAEASVPAVTEQTSAPEPTPGPTQEPTAVPTPTPKVTPIPTPGVNVAFYYRASQVYYTSLIISMPERVSSVSMRLIAPGAEEPALEIELTPQEIEDRFYTLRVGNRDDGFDASSYFANHEDADLSMELSYTVQGDAGEETHVETYEPSEELWIYWRYDSEDDVGGIAEMMFGQIFPNCFVVRLYESTDPEQQLTVGDTAESLKNGGVTIGIRIDGREIPAEAGTLYTAKYRYEGDETTFYDYVLVISIPEDFPQHGTAEMTLTRKLTHSDTIIIKMKTVEY